MRDNQSVRAEDPLFDIDPRPFEVALAKAQAQLDMTQRMPARTRVTDSDPARPLRVGTTATVRVRLP